MSHFPLECSLKLISASFMLRKLYALVSKECCIDNPDSPQNQEVLLPGSLYGMIIKERLEEALNQIRTQITTDVQKGQADFLDSERLYPVSLVKIIHPPRRSVLQQGAEPSEFRHWFKNGQFPRHGKPGFSDRFGSTTSIRIYHCRRETELATVHQSLPVNTSRCFLRGVEDNHCSETSTRSVGSVRSSHVYDIS